MKIEEIKPCKGKILDKFADMYGLKRKKFLFIFKESDKNLRERILDIFKLQNNEEIEKAYQRYCDSHWKKPTNPLGKVLSEQLWSLTPQYHSRETFYEEYKLNYKFRKKWKK